MNKPLILTAALLGTAVTASRVAARHRGFGFERIAERMPEAVPCKWMYRNISAIHSDTERILELLEADRHAATSERARSAA